MTDRRPSKPPRKRIVPLDDIVLGRAAELEDDAAILRQLAEQRVRQGVVIAADEGGVSGRRIGLAVVVAGGGVEQDERRRASRREPLKRLCMLRKAMQMLEQHDIAERIGAEPLDDLVRERAVGMTHDRRHESLDGHASETAVPLDQQRASAGPTGGDCGGNPGGSSAGNEDVYSIDHG